MTATIVTDIGGGPSVGSRVLADTEVSTEVFLSNLDNTGILGWRWEIIDAPPSSALYNPLPSAVVTESFAVTPDVIGEVLLVRLTTYLDAARSLIDSVNQIIVGVRFPEPYAWLIPAAGESLEKDALRGWTVEVNRFMREVRAFVDTGGGSSSLTRVAESISDPGPFDVIVGRINIIDVDDPEDPPVPVFPSGGDVANGDQVGLLIVAEGQVLITPDFGVFDSQLPVIPANVGIVVFTYSAEGEIWDVDGASAAVAALCAAVPSVLVGVDGDGAVSKVATEEGALACIEIDDEGTLSAEFVPSTTVGRLATPRFRATRSSGPWDVEPNEIQLFDASASGAVTGTVNPFPRAGEFFGIRYVAVGAGAVFLDFAAATIVSSQSSSPVQIPPLLNFEFVWHWDAFLVAWVPTALTELLIRMAYTGPGAVAVLTETFTVGAVAIAPRTVLGAAVSGGPVALSTNGPSGLFGYAPATSVFGQLPQSTGLPGRVLFSKLVANTEASAIPQGSAVYTLTTAASENVPEVLLAQADAFATAKVLGLVLDVDFNTSGAEISAAGAGYVALSGALIAIPSGLQGGAAWVIGHRVYLSPTTPGGLTVVMPSTVGQVVTRVGHVVAPLSGGDFQVFIDIHDPMEIV